MKAPWKHWWEVWSICKNDCICLNVKKNKKMLNFRVKTCKNKKLLFAIYATNIKLQAKIRSLEKQKWPCNVQNTKRSIGFVLALSNRRSRPLARTRRSRYEPSLNVCIVILLRTVQQPSVLLGCTTLKSQPYGHGSVVLSCDALKKKAKTEKKTRRNGGPPVGLLTSYALKKIKQHVTGQTETNTMLLLIKCNQNTPSRPQADACSLHFPARRDRWRPQRMTRN